MKLNAIAQALLSIVNSALYPKMTTALIMLDGAASEKAECFAIVPVMVSAIAKNPYFGAGSLFANDAALARLPADTVSVYKARVILSAFLAQSIHSACPRYALEEMEAALTELLDGHPQLSGSQVFNRVAEQAPSITQQLSQQLQEAMTIVRGNNQVQTYMTNLPRQAHNPSQLEASLAAMYTEVSSVINEEITAIDIEVQEVDPALLAQEPELVDEDHELVDDNSDENTEASAPNETQAVLSVDEMLAFIRENGTRDQVAALVEIAYNAVKETVSRKQPIDIRKAACLLIRADNDNFVVVSRKNGSGFGLPGGKVDEGESFAEAALREAIEELFDFTDGSIVEFNELMSSLIPVYTAICEPDDREGWDGKSYLTETFFLPDVKLDSDLFPFVSNEKLHVKLVTLDELETLGGPFGKYNYSVAHAMADLLNTYDL